MLLTSFLLSDFAYWLRWKSADVLGIYFTSRDTAALSAFLVLNWNAKAEERGEEPGSFSKYDFEKLQRLYTKSGTAYRSVRNVVKASNLSVSKVGQFLHSKPLYPKFNQARQENEGICYIRNWSLVQGLDIR